MCLRGTAKGAKQPVDRRRQWLLLCGRICFCWFFLFLTTFFSSTLLLLLLQFELKCCCCKTTPTRRRLTKRAESNWTAPLAKTQMCWVAKERRGVGKKAHNSGVVLIAFAICVLACMYVRVQGSEGSFGRRYRRHGLTLRAFVRWRCWKACRKG